jgi:hypothetical protein
MTVIRAARSTVTPGSRSACIMPFPAMAWPHSRTWTPAAMRAADQGAVGIGVPLAACGPGGVGQDRRGGGAVQHDHDLTMVGVHAARRQHICQPRDAIQSLQRLVVRTALGNVEDDAIDARRIRLFAGLGQGLEAAEARDSLGEAWGGRQGGGQGQGEEEGFHGEFRCAGAGGQGRRATRSIRADRPLWPAPSETSLSWLFRCRMSKSAKASRSSASV